MSRIKVTNNGKILRKRAFSAHLRSKKSAAARARTSSRKVETVKEHPWNKLLQG